MSGCNLIKKNMEQILDPSKKLGIGAALAVCGGLGMILAPTLGLTMLESPWSFLIGMLVGVFAGSGVALSVFGLLSLRQSEIK